MGELQDTSRKLRKPMRALAILALVCISLRAAETNQPVSSSSTNAGALPANEFNVSKDSESQKATNGFGAMLFLTEDKKFFDAWEDSTPPHFTPVSTARRGVPVFTVVIFAGPGLRPNGEADVTFDITVRKPDGSVYAEQKNVVASQDRADPSPKALHLARDYMGIRIEPKDPAGNYTVEAVVRDRVKKVELRLQQRFIVKKDKP
jgi:hypothetical protein